MNEPRLWPYVVAELRAPQRGNGAGAPLSLEERILRRCTTVLGSSTPVPRSSWKGRVSDLVRACTGRGDSSSVIKSLFESTVQAIGAKHLSELSLEERLAIQRLRHPMLEEEPFDELLGRVRQHLTECSDALKEPVAVESSSWVDDSAQLATLSLLHRRAPSCKEKICTPQVLDTLFAESTDGSRTRSRTRELLETLGSEAIDKDRQFTWWTRGDRTTGPTMREVTQELLAAQKELDALDAIIDRGESETHREAVQKDLRRRAFALSRQVQDLRGEPLRFMVGSRAALPQVPTLIKTFYPSALKGPLGSVAGVESWIDGIFTSVASAGEAFVKARVGAEADQCPSTFMDALEQAGRKACIDGAMRLLQELKSDGPHEGGASVPWMVSAFSHVIAKALRLAIQLMLYSFSQYAGDQVSHQICLESGMQLGHAVQSAGSPVPSAVHSAGQSALFKLMSRAISLGIGLIRYSSSKSTTDLPDRLYRAAARGTLKQELKEICSSMFLKEWKEQLVGQISRFLDLIPAPLRGMVTKMAGPLGHAEQPLLVEIKRQRDGLYTVRLFGETGSLPHHTNSDGSTQNPKEWRDVTPESLSTDFFTTLFLHRAESSWMPAEHQGNDALYLGAFQQLVGSSTSSSHDPQLRQTHKGVGHWALSRAYMRDRLRQSEEEEKALLWRMKKTLLFRSIRAVKGKPADLARYQGPIQRALNQLLDHELRHPSERHEEELKRLHATLWDLQKRHPPAQTVVEVQAEAETPAPFMQKVGGWLGWVSPGDEGFWADALVAIVGPEAEPLIRKTLADMVNERAALRPQQRSYLRMAENLASQGTYALTGLTLRDVYAPSGLSWLRVAAVASRVAVLIFCPGRLVMRVGMTLLMSVVTTVALPAICQLACALVPECVLSLARAARKETLIWTAKFLLGRERIDAIRDTAKQWLKRLDRGQELNYRLPAPEAAPEAPRVAAVPDVHVTWVYPEGPPVAAPVDQPAEAVDVPLDPLEACQELLENPRREKWPPEGVRLSEEGIRAAREAGLEAFRQNTEDLRRFLRAVQLLDMPSHEPTNYWHQLPQERVEPTMKLLRNLAYALAGIRQEGPGLVAGKDYLASPFTQSEVVVMLHKLYAIADLLTRRTPDAYLEEKYKTTPWLFAAWSESFKMRVKIPKDDEDATPEAKADTKRASTLDIGCSLVGGESLSQLMAIRRYFKIDPEQAEKLFRDPKSLAKEQKETLFFASDAGAGNGVMRILFNDQPMRITSKSCRSMGEASYFRDLLTKEDVRRRISNRYGEKALVTLKEEELFTRLYDNQSPAVDGAIGPEDRILPDSFDALRSIFDVAHTYMLKRSVLAGAPTYRAQQADLELPAMGLGIDVGLMHMNPVPWQDRGQPKQPKCEIVATPSVVMLRGEDQSLQHVFSQLDADKGIYNDAWRDLCRWRFSAGAEPNVQPLIVDLEHDHHEWAKFRHGDRRSSASITNRPGESTPPWTEWLKARWNSDFVRSRRELPFPELSAHERKLMELTHVCGEDELSRTLGFYRLAPHHLFTPKHVLWLRYELLHTTRLYVQLQRNPKLADILADFFNEVFDSIIKDRKPAHFQKL
ncbi:MAG: hypothetical protein ACOYKZ_07090, partial [Chlamydiia bacterium]